MGFVGLYACSVRRLKSEKRKPANFLGIASLLLLLFVVCLVVALLLLFVCFACVGCVVGGFFPYRTKRKKSAFVLRSFFTWLWCLYSKLSNAIIASL